MILKLEVYIPRLLEAFFPPLWCGACLLASTAASVGGPSSSMLVVSLGWLYGKQNIHPHRVVVVGERATGWDMVEI